MFFQIIETSSAGNCSYLQANEKNILIDAGVGIRKISEYLEGHNLAIGDIDAIFITHEHSDHCKALKSFKKCENLVVYANRDTHESIVYNYPETKDLHWIIFQNGIPFDFYGIKVMAFPLPHDTNDCVGYSFHLGATELVWATDAGFPSKVLLDVVSHANVLVLESNYCPIMLENSSRPYRLKMRISSRNGHLSNADAIEVLKTLNTAQIKKIFLAHISAECNRCEHIADLLEQCTQLSGLLPKIEIVPPRGHSSLPFEL